MGVTKGRRWLAADGDLAEGIAQPGDFQFEDISYEPTDDPLGAIAEHKEDGGRGFCRLTYGCPRTGKPCGGIMIGHPDKPERSPSWKWDGNVEAPTLEPSINCTGGCGWHGYLQQGEFREC